MKTKVTRKGSGRKKGQINKPLKQTPDAIIKQAATGSYRKDVLRVYENLRNIAWRFDDWKRREIYSEILTWINFAPHESPTVELFNVFWPLINAAIKRDARFFHDLARTIDLMIEKDVATKSIFVPPFDPPFYWLGQLLKDFRSNPRGPFSLDEIGDFLETKTGKRPSLSSISSKAKAIGLPVQNRFGKY